MLKLNWKIGGKNSKWKHLNTSHVKVKQAKFEQKYNVPLNLNTSHVKVKQII